MINKYLPIVLAFALGAIITWYIKTDQKHEQIQDAKIQILFNKLSFLQDMRLS